VLQEMHIVLLRRVKQKLTHSIMSAAKTDAILPDMHFFSIKHPLFLLRGKCFKSSPPPLPSYPHLPSVIPAKAGIQENLALMHYMTRLMNTINNITAGSINVKIASYDSI